MNRSFGNHEALARRKFHDSVFQVNKQFPLHDVKEFVVFIVLVPVILSLDDPDSNHRVIDLAERLIEPFVFAGIRDAFSSMISSAGYRTFSRVS
jgi:hypothetical protein